MPSFEWRLSHSPFGEEATSRALPAKVTAKRLLPNLIALSLWSDTEHPGSIHGNRINLAIKSKAIKFEMILMCQRNQKWMNTAAHLWVKEWKGSECVYTMPIRAYCSDAKSERPTLRGLTFELQQKREPGAYHEKQSEIPTTKSYKSFWKECSHLNTTGCNLKSKNGKKKKNHLVSFRSIRGDLRDLKLFFLISYAIIFVGNFRRKILAQDLRENCLVSVRRKTAVLP